MEGVSHGLFYIVKNVSRETWGSIPAACDTTGRMGAVLKARAKAQQGKRNDILSNGTKGFEPLDTRADREGGRGSSSRARTSSSF
jgi:hypothetical protein